jgi:hypothetical protein
MWTAKRLALAAGGVLVLLAAFVAGRFLMSSHTSASKSQALSDASLASQRASAGARMVGAKNADQVGSPSGR